MSVIRFRCGHILVIELTAVDILVMLCSCRRQLLSIAIRCLNDNEPDVRKVTFLILLHKSLFFCQ